MTYITDYDGTVLPAKERDGSYKGTPCLGCGVSVTDGTLLCPEHINITAPALKGGEWKRDKNGVMRWVK